MGLDANHLLRRLRPTGAPNLPVRSGSASSPGSIGEFARLISLAESDQIDSGRPVSGDGVSSLDPDQRRRIARACDSLESSGFEDGLVLLGGRAFVVETAGRTIQRELGSEDLGEVHDLGGIVMVEAPDTDDPSEPAPDGRVPRLSANTALHPDLVGRHRDGRHPS